MDLLIKDGDHAVNSRGLPIVIHGPLEKLQRATIQLATRRGSFALDERIGSLLYTVSEAPPQNRGTLALSYAQDALSTIDGVRATDANCVYNHSSDRLEINVTVRIDGMESLIKVDI